MSNLQTYIYGISPVVNATEVNASNSQFRETSKDVASGAVSGNLNMNTGSYGNSLSQWGMQAATNAYQKTSNAIGKAIKKNKVKLKYGTFVYLVNGREKQ